MKQNFLFILLFLAMLMFLCPKTSAQTLLTVTKTNGEVQNFSVAEDGNLAFDAVNLLIFTNENTQTAIPRNEIRKLTIDSQTSGQEAIQAGTRLVLYPNPSDGQISIVSGRDEYLAITIFSIDGKTLLSGNYRSNEIIDVSFLHRGVYFVKTDSISLKFIKL